MSAFIVCVPQYQATKVCVFLRLYEKKRVMGCLPLNCVVSELMIYKR
jgi:hypothetical protein